MNALEIPGLTSTGDLLTLTSLVKSLDNPKVIEIGSWFGRSAMAMFEAGAKEVHCIDRWDGGTNPNDIVQQRAANLGQDVVLQKFKNNIGDILNNGIFMYVGDSLYWASQWIEIVDMIFIDSDHRYEHVIADIKAWSKFVRKGGILCGHDYSEVWPGVMKAVDETGGYTDIKNSLWWRIM